MTHRVCVLGARGRMGRFAVELLEATSGFEVAGAFDSEDALPEVLAESTAQLALDFTVAGLGCAHGRLCLEAGLRPVIGTSGVSPEETDALDRLARSLDLGGLVVPNFSLGMSLLQRAAEEAARLLPDCEIIELHHARKRDAPSGTALDTRHRLARVRGREAAEVPIHSVRLPGLYAHQEVLLSGPGEWLTLRHDMLGPEAFGPGILLALDYAKGARGVGRGLDLALRGNGPSGVS